MISIVIPHKNRHSVLYMTLEKLNEQSVDDFEVIVVDDGSDIYPQDWIDVLFPNFSPKYNLIWERNPFKGPNSARNIGVNVAKNDYVVISGSDTIPSRSFLMHHMLDLKNNPDKLIQGFTPFHPHVMDTEFMVWLDASGVQANWGALRTDNGWKRKADGYCLTTNLAMSKTLFHNIGQFSASFSGAAWDDIEFGIRARKVGVETLFNHKAVNFHYHKYNIQSFSERQKMEGRNRKSLCLEHPEMAMQLFDLNMIKQAKEQSLEEWIHQSIQLSYVKGIEQEKYQTWGNTMSLASFVGVLESIEGNEYMQLIPELSNQESVVYLFALIKAENEGNLAYVDHCAGWISEKEEKWLSEYLFGLVKNRMGNKEESLVHMYNSLGLKDNSYAKRYI